MSHDNDDSDNDYNDNDSKDSDNESDNDVSDNIDNDFDDNDEDSDLIMMSMTKIKVTMILASYETMITLGFHWGGNK